jgi:TonB-linked SusC/RagA family outer membrane protein
MAQNGEETNQVTIESIVKNEEGNPIKGATIYGNEGLVIAKTDTSGRFTITVSDLSDLLIECGGYESARFKPAEYKAHREFILKSSPYLLGGEDEVNVAFGKMKMGNIVNAISVIRPDNIRKYDNIQSVSDALTGRVPGLLGSSNIRGLGNALFIIDGVPRDINSINMSEVAQITVLKDINSRILYGSAAANGVVLITTKKGQPYKKQLNVSAYYGVSTPAALPRYLSSADYMTFNNKARINDGLDPLYSSTAIDNYRSGNPYIYPNVDYYSSQYLKKVKPFFRLMTDLSGGNDNVTYYANMGWDQTGSLLNFGEGKSAKDNKFNVRGNVNMKINEWINSSLDVAAIFDNNESPVGNYWSEASVLQPNLFSPLIPIDQISSGNQLLASHTNDIGGKYLLGGASSYLTGPIADVYSGGVNTNIQRTFSFNNRINFNLGQWVEGLSFHTNISFDFYTAYDQSINNQYSVYQPTWNASGDSITSLEQYGKDARPGTQNVTDPYFERRFGFYGMFDYDRTFGKDNHVTGTLLGYGDTYSSQGVVQPDKNANLGLRLGYGYKNKYLIDFSGAYTNSVKLSKGSRLAFSPSLGLAWVASAENFMSSVTAVNYLKFRLSAGILNTDAGIGGTYNYDNEYTTSGGFYWDEGVLANNGTVSSYGGNDRLGFEKRKDLNFGVAGLFFNRVLTVNANIFASVNSDIAIRPLNKFPDYYADFVPYENFDKNSYHGAELALSVTRNFNGVSFTLGANVLYTTSKALKRDGIFSNKYQDTVGHPVDAIFGLVADGFYQNDADIDKHAIPAFGAVQPGDIKYVDQNKDGVIDQNDETYIGRSQAPFSYGLNLKLSYKGFTFFVLGEGRVGGDSFMSGSYYWVDGDDKYSEYVLNSWTESNQKTATYPRLSSLSNTNDFQNSTFWLYRNDYFTLDRAQITYELPGTITNSLRMEHLGFYLNASNLLTISKHNNIRNLNIGGEPIYRSFSAGIKILF